MNPIARRKLLFEKNRFDDTVDKAFKRIADKKERLRDAVSYAVDELGVDEEDVYNLLGYEDPRLVAELFGFDEEEEEE